jgi:signal transduction histidine kinase
LGNALKYTEKGFITVSLYPQETNSSSHAVDFELSVEDSGRGMSTDYQNTKLFAPFSQENPFASGTGLGLSIVKQIVESLKGVVDVQSTLHVGTKVSVSLRLPTVPAEKGRASSTVHSSPDTLKDKVASVLFPSVSVTLVPYGLLHLQDYR